MKLIFKLALEDDRTTQFEGAHCHNRETVGVLSKRKGTRRIIKNLARCCVQHGYIAHEGIHSTQESSNLTMISRRLRNIFMTDKDYSLT